MKTLLALLFVLAVAPALARADEAADRRAAKALLDEGVAAYDRGDYGAALDLFERGYQIYPSATLLMNMGTTYVQLGRGVDAANAYQAFLDDPNATGPRASEIRNSLAILDTTVGRLGVTADDDVELQLGDGPWLPASRARLVRVAPGTYVVRARRGGHTVDVTGRIGAGESQSIAPAFPPPVAIAPAPVEVAPPPEAPLAPPAPPSRRRTVALVSAGVGVVAVGAGVVLAMRATSRYDESRALCERAGGCGADFGRAMSLSESADTDRLLAIASFVVGGSAIAAGMVLWIKTPRRDSHASAALTFTTAPGELGLAAFGNF